IHPDRRVDTDLKDGKQLIDPTADLGVAAQKVLDPPPRAAEAIELHRVRDQLALARFVQIVTQGQRHPAGEPAQKLLRRPFAGRERGARLEVSVDAADNLLETISLGRIEAEEHLLETKQK